MSTPTTLSTTTGAHVHIDRPTEWSHEGLQFADTGCEPIASWCRGEWLLFTYGGDLPFVLGGHRDMADDEIQALAAAALSDD